MAFKININNVEFVKSAAAVKDFIKSERPNVIFAGKSNVGKSSVINSLLRRKNFARVGSTPGKTVLINYFNVDNSFYLVDLPGYGYAAVSKAVKASWAKLVGSFFDDRSNIDFGVFIVDSRHSPTADDKIMASWFKGSGKPFVVVANKSDKISSKKAEENIRIIRDELKLNDDEEIILYSGLKNTGRNELLNYILNNI